MALLLVFVPVAALLRYVVPDQPLLAFAAAMLAIVPLADLIRKATEHLAETTGPALGGLLNVTFGNISELILALFVLSAGHQEVVKGQITGAILGNALLGLGLAILAGARRGQRQTFDRHSAGLQSSMLILAVIGLLLPALFHYTEAAQVSAATTAVLDERLSLGTSVVLVVLYIGYLVFTLQGPSAYPKTAEGEAEALTDAVHHGAEGTPWPWTKALGMLVGATLLVVWMSEIISTTLEASAERLGLSTFFLGVVVLAVVGAAAEYLSAIYFARKGRMDLVLGITLGSTIQIALLVAPVLVLVSWMLGTPMNLVFENPLELIAIAAVAFSVNAIAHDGETHWYEGMMLVGVYTLFVIAFYFVTPPVA